MSEFFHVGLMANIKWMKFHLLKLHKWNWMLLTGIPWDPENVIFFKGLTKDAENNDVTKSLEKFNDFFKREKLWDMTKNYTTVV